MASLGIARFADLIGRADFLQCSSESEIDLNALLVAVPETSIPGAHVALPPSNLAERLLADAEPALAGEQSVLAQYIIHNDDRSIGAGLAGEVARRYGNIGLPGVSITATFQGSAGQSFGAYNVPGMRLILNGEANDYVGKSMTGGQIIIAPPSDAPYASEENTILGNTILYGATGGQLFAAGRAGERFAVRNSGAIAVVEGVGDHGCEYMTGGMVVVLGETGQNFAAGMSNGVAYVLDTQELFSTRCNTELVDLQRIDDQRESDALRTVVEWHVRKTHSKYAERILTHWENMRHAFWRVLPRNTQMSACDFVDSGEYDTSLMKATH